MANNFAIGTTQSILKKYYIKSKYRFAGVVMIYIHNFLPVKGMSEIKLYFMICFCIVLNAVYVLYESGIWIKVCFIS